MSLYEAMFLLDNRQANRDWDGSLDGVKAIVTKHGGDIVRCEKWGERRLAYEIQGRRRGTYLLMYFNAEGEAVNHIYRESELSELVLRALMLKVSVLPPEEKPAEKPAEKPVEKSAEKPAETDKAPVEKAVETASAEAAVEKAAEAVTADAVAELEPVAAAEEETAAVEIETDGIAPQDEVAADSEKKEEAAEDA